MRRTVPVRRVAFVAAGAAFLQLLDSAIIATSLPQMAIDFGVSPLDMSLGVSSYLLASAVFMPLSAWLSSRVGAVRLFLAAIVFFTLASIACAIAQTLPQFVAARVFQGIAGAFLVPVGRAIALSRAGKHEVLDVVATMTWPALIAPVIGPVLGGAITGYFGWRYNFLINVPIGLLGCVLVFLFMQADGKVERRPFDWRGFVLVAAGLSLLLGGLETMLHSDRLLLVALALVACGLVACGLAVAHLQRTAAPLISLSPFRQASFALSTLAGGSYNRLAVDAMPFLLPIMLQVGVGFDPLAAGSMMFIYFTGNLGMKVVTSRILRRWGFRPVLIGNGVLCAASIAACAAIAPGMPAWMIGAILLWSGLTRSMQFTSLSSLAFADIETADRNSASALISIIQQITLVFTVALAALVLKLSLALRMAPDLALVDFQAAVLVMASLAGLSVLLMLRLHPLAGNAIAGKRLAPVHAQTPGSSR